MNRNTAAFLALFLGGLGMHKFYLGKPIVGLMYLALCFTLVPAIVSLFEALAMFGMSDAAFKKKYARES